MTALAVAELGGRTGLPRPAEHTCWLCGSHGLRRFVDLGVTPRCDLFFTPEAAEADVAYSAARVDV